ncbi:MAG: phosphoribosylglycinamide formyltransferase [Bacteroidota bacterium]
MEVQKKHLAILASGSGTNAENLIRYFTDHDQVSVDLVLSNKKDAFVLERARKAEIPSLLFSREEFNNVNFLEKLEEIDYLILAGFLWLIPNYLIEAFPGRIINIHPSLLPKFGGKGMYGSYVHEAVIQNQESKSGITIHLVNERYDEGKVLFQASCPVNLDDTADSLAAKIHQLEYEHFPKVIEKYIQDQEGD